jgi:hypothetical protein
MLLYLILTTAEVPLPPLSRLGFPEFSSLEQMPAAGITLQDTIFIDRQQHSESICFHELVHVIQWDTLGVDYFLLAYGAGLSKLGYWNCPYKCGQCIYPCHIGTLRKVALINSAKR